MAEETDHTPERQNIAGDDQDNSKDNSAGKRRVVNKRDITVPHYLRASTGSCHDACKYGKPHEFKNKPWKPMGRRVSALPPDSEKPEEIQIFVDKKVKVILQGDKPEPSLPQDSPPVDGIKKHIPSTRKSPEPNTRKSPEPKTGKSLEPKTRKSSEPKTRISSEPKTRKSPEPNSSSVIKQEVKSFRKSPTPEPPKAAKKVVRSSGKLSSPDILKPIKQEVSSTAKRDVSSKRASSIAKERIASVGPSKSNISPMKPSTSADSSIGKRGSKTAFVNNLRASRVSVKKDMVPPPTVLSSKKTPKVEVKRILNSSVTGPSRKSPVSKPGSSNLIKNKTPNLKSQASPKNQMVTKKVKSKKPTEENVEEKTLHMIETREDCLSSAAQNGSHFIQSPSPLSPESLNSSSQETSHSFASHETDDEQDLGSEYTDSEVDDSNKEKAKVGHDARTVDPGDRDLASMKLKFRRGKTAEPQPETNSSRRLRYRQGKAPEVSPGVNGGPGRRSYRRRDTDSGKKEPERGSVKVVLKHQEIETKKDGQVLLNNVIEEAASKLVQVRKSKVKALVGAFESVISLQESKPSSATTAATNR